MPIADFHTIFAYAHQPHVARLTFWSTNPDRQRGGSSTDGDSRSEVSQSAYGYTKVFVRYTG